MILNFNFLHLDITASAYLHIIYKYLVSKMQIPYQKADKNVPYMALTTKNVLPHAMGPPHKQPRRGQH